MQEHILIARNIVKANQGPSGHLESADKQFGKIEKDE